MCIVTGAIMGYYLQYITLLYTVAGPINVFFVLMSSLILDGC